MNISRPNAWSLTISIVEIALRRPRFILEFFHLRYIRTLLRAIGREPFKVILYNLLTRLIQKDTLLPDRPTRMYRNQQIVLHCEILTFFRSRVYISGWAQARWGIENICLFQDGILLAEAVYGHWRPNIDTFFQKEDSNPYGFYILAIPIKTPDIFLLEATANTGAKLTITLTYTAPYGPENYERLRQLDAALTTRQLILPYTLSQPFFYVIKQYPPASVLPLHDHKKNTNTDFRIITRISDIRTETGKRQTWCIFQRQSDFLSENALMIIGQTIGKSAIKRGLIYWDEDLRAPEGYYHSPHYKPEFNLTYLLSWNYIGDNFCVDRETVLEYLVNYEKEPEEISPFSILLYTVWKNFSIRHIPHVLTSRQEPVIDNDESQIYCKIIADYLEKCPVNGMVLPGLSEDTFHIKYLSDREPAVEIVIPFKDQPDQLWRCLESIYENNIYSNFSVRLIDNNSSEDSTRQMLVTILNTFPRTNIESDNQPFNFSRINNSAVSGSSADYILFLNSDTEVINAEWLENLVAEAEAPDVAAVGACLLYPDDTIQHAGVIVGLGGVAEHAHKHYDAGEKGYFNKLICSQEVMACTAACLLVNRDLFILAGGFDDEHLPINFNDVDLCLRLREKGYKIIYSPHARLYHHESLTRGRHQDKIAYDLARKEAQYIKTRWKTYIRKGDPNYPLFFSYGDGSYSLR